MSRYARIQGWHFGYARWPGGWGTSGLLLFWLILLAAIVGLVIWLVRRGGGPRDDSLEDIIRRRYARGEIDRATYQQMLEDLRGERRPPQPPGPTRPPQPQPS